LLFLQGTYFHIVQQTIFENLLSIYQSAEIQRVGTNSTVNGDTGINSIVEFIIPDFGYATDIIFDYRLEARTQTPNGGSASATGHFLLENVTQGVTLADVTITSQNQPITQSSQDLLLLQATAGEIFRLSFIREAHAALPAGSDPFGRASVYVHSKIGIIESTTAVTVPEPTSVALMSLGLAGLGFARRKKS